MIASQQIEKIRITMKEENRGGKKEKKSDKFSKKQSFHKRIDWQNLKSFVHIAKSLSFMWKIKRRVVYYSAIV